MTNHRVAIFGKFCSGKTTLARALEDEFGFARVSMAANMKNIVKEVYGVTDKAALVDVRTQDNQLHQITVRELLQSFGEAAKGHDLHFWLRWFLADTQFMDGIPLVMDDARLRFEADALRERGWFLVRLEVPDAVRTERHERLYGAPPTAAQMAHRTETECELIDVDLVLDGTQSPESLAERVVIELGLSFLSEDF